MQLIFLLLRMLLLGPVYGVIITLAVVGVRRQFRTSEPVVVGNLHYGANYIHPKHLVIWYFVRINGDLEAARAEGMEQALQVETRHRLSQLGYPKSVLGDVNIGMESRENVDKGCGDWCYFH